MTLKHLKRNLVNASIEILLDDIPHPEYLEQSRVGNEIADAVAEAVSCGVGTRGGEIQADNYKAIVQGLFEGGFLDTGESDYSFDLLISYALGVKMYHALDVFNELFDMLEAGGYTDPREYETQYNPSGDNYYSAMTFGIKPDKDGVGVCRSWCLLDATKDELIADELIAKGIHRKVIFVTNQSPSWCYVLEFSIHTGEPKSLYFVRLKENYDDPEKIQDVIDMDANFTDSGSGGFSAYNDSQPHRILARLDIDDMNCKEGWWEPKRVEYCLFNIYSGRDSMRDDQGE